MSILEAYFRVCRDHKLRIEVRDGLAYCYEGNQRLGWIGSEGYAGTDSRVRKAHKLLRYICARYKGIPHFKEPGRFGIDFQRFKAFYPATALERIL